MRLCINHSGNLRKHLKTFKVKTRFHILSIVCAQQNSSFWLLFSTQLRDISFASSDWFQVIKSQIEMFSNIAISSLSSNHSEFRIQFSPDSRWSGQTRRGQPLTGRCGPSCTVRGSLPGPDCCRLQMDGCLRNYEYVKIEFFAFLSNHLHTNFAHDFQAPIKNLPKNSVNKFGQNIESKNLVKNLAKKNWSKIWPKIWPKNFVNKFGQKFGQKIGQKSWSKNWVKNLVTNVAKKIWSTNLVKNLVKKLAQKFCPKFGQKFGQKIWSKIWPKNLA